MHQNLTNDSVLAFLSQIQIFIQVVQLAIFQLYKRVKLSNSQEQFIEAITSLQETNNALLAKLSVIYQQKNMGQVDSKINVKEGELQKFGKVEYLFSEHPSQPVKMRVNIQVSKQEEDFKQWGVKVQKLRKKPQISELLVLPLEIKSNSCFVCTKSNKKSLLTIYYEKMNLSLFQVIKNRRYFKKYFSESEIWYLLYVLVKVASYFQQQSDYIGNIHTTNILLNEKSRIRLFTLYSSPNQVQNLTKIRQSRHVDTFIAPEQIRFIHEDSFACINDCNRNKVDTFNIGLVLISTLMLKDCYQVYARTLFQLNQQKLAATIQDMRKTHLNSKYSWSLINLIQSFLIVDPSIRKTPKYFYQILKKNQIKILELQAFQLEISSAKERSTSVSPEVIHYLEKTSPNTKQSKYLSLAKNKRYKKIQQVSENILDQEESRKKQGKKETTLTRKLFNE